MVFMRKTAYIIDGYIDEPACLGVPPYISPYTRTVAGLLSLEEYETGYLTIDQIRKDPGLLKGPAESDIVVMIAGVTVPGTYLGGTPATSTEIQQIGSLLTRPVTCIGGPVQFGYSHGGGTPARKMALSGFDTILTGNPATALHHMLAGGDPAGELNYHLLDPWSVAGAGIIRKHPSYPRVMCELETARGCSHAITGGCSFCTEPLYGKPVYRGIQAIAEEVSALYREGARHFRLGRQPDLLVYQSLSGEFPKPVPEKIEELFSTIRYAAPDLCTLHIDNINPGTIARHPDAARAALKAIVHGHTAGDVAAFGMESADPAVIRANNLKATSDQVMDAIRIVNEVGGARRDGIPELLPGLNFIAGLAGETADTYQLNQQFLKRLLASGLFVRRVNIRQVMPFYGTPAYETNTLSRYDRHFRSFKEWVRTHFDRPMLQKVFPLGTVLCDVWIEKEATKTDPAFGRQMGSYPILVGIPAVIPSTISGDVVVTGYGMRSLTGFFTPIPINELPTRALPHLPAIGKKRLSTILSKRPFHSLADLEEVIGKTEINHHYIFTSPEVPSPS